MHFGLRSQAQRNIFTSGSEPDQKKEGEGSQVSMVLLSAQIRDVWRQCVTEERAVGSIRTIPFSPHPRAKDWSGLAGAKPSSLQNSCGNVQVWFALSKCCRVGTCGAHLSRGQAWELGRGNPPHWAVPRAELCLLLYSQPCQSVPHSNAAWPCLCRLCCITSSWLER